MQTQAQQNRFQQAFAASIPVAAAYVPLGAAKAILMIGIGLDWYWPLITSVLVYAGSLEFLIVSYVASGMSLPMVAWTTFLVNFRHLFYGLSYPLGRHRKKLSKLYGMFALTDEAYVLTTLGAGRDFDGKTLLFLQMLMQCWWFTGSCLGVIIGQNLPDSFRGFEFAMTAMFVVLALDSLSKQRSAKTLMFAAIAILIAFASEKYGMPDSFLLSGLLSYFALLSADFLWQNRQNDV